MKAEIKQKANRILELLKTCLVTDVITQEQYDGVAERLIKLVAMVGQTDDEKALDVVLKSVDSLLIGLEALVNEDESPVK